MRDAVVNRVPSSAHQLNPDLPVEFENIILKATEKKPELRYQLASEICGDLKSVKRNLDSRSAVLAPTFPAGVNPVRRHTRNWARYRRPGRGKYRQVYEEGFGQEKLSASSWF